MSSGAPSAGHEAVVYYCCKLSAIFTCFTIFFFFYINLFLQPTLEMLRYFIFLTLQITFMISFKLDVKLIAFRQVTNNIPIVNISRPSQAELVKLVDRDL